MVISGDIQREEGESLVISKGVLWAARAVAKVGSHAAGVGQIPTQVAVRGLVLHAAHRDSHLGHAGTEAVQKRGTAAERRGQAAERLSWYEMAQACGS